MKTLHALIMVSVLAGTVSPLPLLAEQRKTLPQLTQEMHHTVHVCPMHPEIRRKEAGVCPICGMTLEPQEATAQDQALFEEKAPAPTPLVPATSEAPKAKESPAKTGSQKIYTCPMHPQIRLKHPGSCPICGMTLVAVEEEKPTGATSTVKGFAPVTITPERQWQIGVKTEVVKKENLTRQLRTMGTVAYDTNLYIAQKEFLEAVKTDKAAGSSSMVSASRRKLTLLGMTPEGIADLEKLAQVDESLFLPEGTGVAWIYSTIYESDRPLLRQGLKVDIKSVGHPQQGYTGVVDSIIPVVDPLTRTITVRSRVMDPIGLLKPDMFVDVYIEIPLGKELSVSRSAVLQTGLRNIVMVAKGNGVFEPRAVELGQATKDRYQILKGLSEGDRVVTSANFLIDSESQINGAFSNPAEEHTHDH